MNYWTFFGFDLLEHIGIGSIGIGFIGLILDWTDSEKQLDIGLDTE